MPMVWTATGLILYCMLAVFVVVACEKEASQELARATVPVKLLLVVFAPITIVMMLFLVLVIDPYSARHHSQ